MKLSLSIVIALLLSAQAFADVRTVKGESAKEKIDIARVQQQITLVDKMKGNSDMRVSLVVLDNGGSTDVSPHAMLYLTMHNEDEAYGATSSHLISPINDIISYKRVKAGVYEVVVNNMDSAGDCRGTLFNKETIRIDARKLSVSVRNFKGAEEFVSSRVQDPITVSTKTVCKNQKK